MQLLKQSLHLQHRLEQKFTGKQGENIKTAQKRQKIQYDRRHTSPTELKAGMQVLLQNNKRKDRKGGKFSYKWRGPYILQEIDHKGVASLQTMSGGKLKTRYNVAQLTQYHESLSEGKRANVMEMPSTLETNPDASNEQPNSSDENSIGSRNPLESQTATPDQVLGDKNMNYWDRLPLEMFEKILRISIQSSRNPCETYQSLYKTCKSFRDTVDMISSNILPRLYINNQARIQRGDLGIYPPSIFWK